MKTRIQLIISFALLVLLSSCGSESQLENGDTISFPDTAAFRQSWKMNEQQMLTELFANDTFYNQLGLDTLELTYTPCDCPDWIDRSKLELDCKECSDFYTEAADPSLVFPSAFLVSGNTVRFYGVRIPGMNLPAGREFTTPNPPAWTVFRYYGYEVLRPYKVWGPNMKQFQAPSDTVVYSVVLSIP